MNIEEYWLELVVVLTLLAMSGTFSAAETGITALSRTRVLRLEKAGVKGAKAVHKLIAQRSKLVTTLVISNNLVNVFSSALATGVLIKAFGEAGIAYATIVISVMIVIFSEVFPKQYALRHAEGLALSLSPFLRGLVWLMRPMAFAVDRIVFVLLTIFDRRTKAIDLTSVEELRGAIDLHGREGGMVWDDRAMLDAILDLGDLFVQDIMVHRNKMVVVDIDLPPAQIVEQVLSSPFSRIPLYRDDPENIIGVVHAKNILKAVAANGVDKLDIAPLMAPPWFIPATTTLREQLKAFRERRTHFALVVDEYGALLGLVTLEDVLEEIVGDITDEHDVVIAGVQNKPDGSLIVDGQVPIRDLNRKFQWELPDDEASTIAGLVIHEAKIIPSVGQQFSFHGFTFEIQGRAGARITRLRLVPPQSAEAEPERHAE